MSVFEIRDEAIDAAEINRRVEENLKKRQPNRAQRKMPAPDRFEKEWLDFSIDDADFRDNLRFLRSKIGELPDYKVFGLYKALRRFVRKQITIDKGLGYIVHSIAWQIKSLYRYMEELDTRIGKLAASQQAPSSSVIDTGRNEGRRQQTENDKEIIDRFHFRLDSEYGGSDEEIRKRTAEYIGYLQGDRPVLNVGCGRGVFLEILRENGISAEGVDDNKYMVEACLEKGLDVHCAHAIDYLAEQPDSQLHGIVVFQAVDRLPGDNLTRLAMLCHEKLIPGGCAIFEVQESLYPGIPSEHSRLGRPNVEMVRPDILKLLLETIGFSVRQTTLFQPSEGGGKSQPLDHENGGPGQKQAADHIHARKVSCSGCGCAIVAMK